MFLVTLCFYIKTLRGNLQERRLREGACECEDIRHMVEAHDSFSNLALAYRVAPQDIKRANKVPMAPDADAVTYVFLKIPICKVPRHMQGRAVDVVRGRGPPRAAPTAAVCDG